MKNKTHIKPGDKFGKLTALKYVRTGKHHRRYFLFACECGNEKILQVSNVSTGNTKSCGCLAKAARVKQRLPGNLGVINQIMLQYKRHARNRSYGFSLSKNRFRELISMPCNYCGDENTNIKVTKNCQEGFAHNGIDRLDNSKGYTNENSVPCCRACNYAKRDMPVKQFQEWAKRLGVNAMAQQWG